jgi:ribosomal protein S18 acetylase RimI-like enzyme
MTGAEPCRFLEWDSRHFGLRIARVESSRLTPELVASIRRWCGEKSIDCAYFLTDDAASGRLAAEGGYRLVDVRVTLARDPEPAPDAEAGRVRRYDPADLPKLCRIARTSHRNTRFYVDGRFPASKCDELYEIWIRKSCEGEAQAVFVAADGETVEGYLTCHLEPSGEGKIGLVAVAEEGRGKGFGRALVLESLRWFGVRRVSVVTQGANAGAMRLYESCGFRGRSEQLWYHGWFREATA